jgi:hypothetical protein
LAWLSPIGVLIFAAVRRCDHDDDQGKAVKKTKASKARTALKAGGFSTQHNRRLKISSSLKAGDFSTQHNRRLRPA